MRELYLPTLRANYVVWPAVQMVNFLVMPLRFQVVRLLLNSFLFLFISLPPSLPPSLFIHADSMPAQPFVSSIGIAWNAYLSLSNAESRDGDE